MPQDPAHCVYKDPYIEYTLVKVDRGLSLLML